MRVAQFMTKRGNLRSKKIRPIDDEGNSYTVSTMEGERSVSTVSGTDSGMDAASRAVNVRRGIVPGGNVEKLYITYDVKLY